MKIKDNWHLPSHAKAAKRSKEEVHYVEQPPMSAELKQAGLGKKYYISTYGCQANERDSETLRGFLEGMGFEESTKPQGSDLILLNTCGIRENATNTVLGEVGAYKQMYYDSKKEMVIGICGCMSQEEGFVQTILEKYPQVRLLFGTHNINDLPNLVSQAMKGERVVEIYSKEGDVVENLPEKRYQKHKAWVNVMYGCDKFCTYCIVPYTRGKERSRKAEDIINEIKTLKKLGYKEVTLLGQNVNAYGKDLEGQPQFGQLLEMVAQEGIDRIRFMTSHPWDFSDEMIDVIAKYDNVMPYIHLPLQSGDDGVLARMGRRYSQKHYLELFHKIKDRVPNASFSTDIIVGFPEESREAFERTLDVVRECAYDMAFTFIYSPRPGTPAARMEDSIDLETKRERLQELNKVWNELALEKNKALEGTVVEVLCDGPSKKDASTFSGYTPQMKLVNFTGENCQVGDLVKVYIDQAKTFSLDGHVVEG